MTTKKASPAARAQFFARQKMLVAAAQGGDESAFKVLLEDLEPWINRKASYYGQLFKSHVTIEELRLEGQIGAWKALGKFDPGRGVPFFYYARWWVTDAIQKFTKKASRMGRFGPKKGAAPQYLDEDGMQNIDSVSVRYYETHGDPFLDGMLEMENQHSNVERAAFALGALSDRQRLTIERRYLQDKPDTLGAIGKDLGISFERVRQLESEAFLAMRKRCLPRKEA